MGQIWDLTQIAPAFWQCQDFENLPSGNSSLIKFFLSEISNFEAGCGGECVRVTGTFRNEKGLRSGCWGFGIINDQKTHSRPDLAMI